MTTPRSTDAIVAHAKKRYAATENKIAKAIKDMRRKGLTINPQTVAKHARVSRKSVYNHSNLLDQIHAESAKPTLNPAPTTPQPDTESSIVTALREQLRTQKQRYQTEIAELKAENKTLEQALATAHGELHRLRNTATPTASQRR
ncbi:transposase [Mycobacterium sp. ENV421]|uniref:Transposase n=6 Tax=Mycobacteriaceae TaxID=1762 RepID=A0A0J6WLN5_9MYCO|nr:MULTISPECIES: DUF6262 family protein [Mycobacteriaceae]ABM16190.1 Tn554 transposase C [Mycolicibacterium vanbaalenii PYR-1]KMO82632.1 hypothetical protein MCHLDSM_01255 [Mycolicibacterium chlorophenolicum]MCX2715964.1 DUF6262 family protein [Mycolicibacterium sp. J2]ORJ52720.1 transposase [Mycobacterium simiae]PND55080.1 transposase [Mycobacterium sp. ENV421]